MRVCRRSRDGGEQHVRGLGGVGRPQGAGATGGERRNASLKARPAGGSCRSGALGSAPTRYMPRSATRSAAEAFGGSQKPSLGPISVTFGPSVSRMARMNSAAWPPQ